MVPNSRKNLRRVANEDPVFVGGGRENGCVTESPSAAAQRLLVQAADALREAAGSSSDTELVALLTTCESVVRRLDRATVDAVAALDRRGVFAERGYKSAAAALSDLLGWERFEARRRVVAAEQVTLRAGLDGSVLPARLPATADGVRAGPDESAARRGDRPGAGQQAGGAALARGVGRRGGAARRSGRPVHPAELHEWGTALVELLDQDGAEARRPPPARVNELFLSRLPDGGGKIKGRFDDAAMFDAIAAVIDAHAKPLTATTTVSAGEAAGRGAGGCVRVRARPR